MRLFGCALAQALLQVVLYALVHQGLKVITEESVAAVSSTAATGCCHVAAGKELVLLPPAGAPGSG